MEKMETKMRYIINKNAVYANIADLLEALEKDPEAPAKQVAADLKDWLVKIMAGNK